MAIITMIFQIFIIGLMVVALKVGFAFMVFSIKMIFGKKAEVPNVFGIVNDEFVKRKGKLKWKK